MIKFRLVAKSFREFISRFTPTMIKKMGMKNP
jgi:hypothetical protein